MRECEKMAKYKYREKGKRYQLDFYPSEQELIDWLDAQPVRAKYIKDLIREDMKRRGL